MPADIEQNWCHGPEPSPTASDTTRAPAATPDATRRAEGDKGSMPFSSVEDAIAAVGRGEIVVVVDDEDRENEGDLIMAADAVTPEKIAFFLAHTSGLICVPLTPERVEHLDLPLMVTSNTEVQRTAFTVSVDYRHGTSTGISAADRAATIKALVDPHIRPTDLNRPGHIFPLRYRPGGVLKRAGHTEAAVDLARAAGMSPAGVLCEVVSEDKTGMARLPELDRVRRASTVSTSSPSPTSSATGGTRTSWCAASPMPGSPPTSGSSPSTPTSRCSTGSTTWPWSRGRCDGQAEHPGAGAQRVPDRRRVRLAAVRLRPPAPRGHVGHRRERQRRHRLPSRPRGPGHRPGPQAARLQPAGGGLRHRRRQPRARACRPTPASTGSGRRSWSTWA